jgi:hypothetical protein
VRVSLGGAPATEIAIPAGRTVPGFYVLGEGAELRVKDLKLQALE